MLYTVLTILFSLVLIVLWCPNITMSEASSNVTLVSGEYQTNIFVSCNTGYVLYGLCFDMGCIFEYNTTCLDDGYWSITDTCQRKFTYLWIDV